MVDIRLISKIVFVLMISFLCIQCNNTNREKRQAAMKEGEYTWVVRSTKQVPEINANWNKEIWKNTAAISLDNYMGEKPSHFPDTQVKLLYDEDNIYAIFNVKDRYVKAVEKNINGKVWEDSCVEFFFSPGPDTLRGYFNLEVNCKGVFLFEFHTGGTKGFVSAEDYEKIKISHSLKRDAEEEIDEALEWQIEYSIPFSILSNYMNVEKPGPGVSWRANFYKIADKTSHPHWLTWAFVDYPRPRFHLPEFFGQLDFE